MLNFKILPALLFFVISAPNLYGQDAILAEKPPAAENALAGWSTALFGNWAVTTAPQKDVTDIMSAGEAYFYNFNGEEWVLTQTFQPQHLIPMRNFGVSAAMDQNTAIISAVGNHRDGHFSGSLHLFELNNGQWSQTEMLKSSEASIGHRFGYSADIHQNMIVSGAYMADGNELKSGAVYVFDKVDGTWTESAKLIADDGKNGDHFGFTTHIIDHQTIAVGAYNADISDTGEGAVYLFKKADGEWEQSAKLVSPSGLTSSAFGYSLTSIQYEESQAGKKLLFIGAPGGETTEKKTGAVYLFSNSGDDNWVFDSKFSHDESTSNNFFGISLATDDVESLYVGASRKSSENDTESGSMYIYSISNGNNSISISPLMEVTAAKTQDYQHFGANISASNEFILVSSPYTNRDGKSNSGSFHFYSDLTVSVEGHEEIVTTYGLNQNYPNPFNPVTTIQYQVPESGHVRLEVFDTVGRRVAVLVNETIEAGVHNVTFDASHLASGVYFYRFVASGNVFTKKLTLIK